MERLLRAKPKDVADLKAYLDTVPDIATPAHQHELAWPLSDRKFLGAWKTLNFTARPGIEMTRGAYLVSLLGHCGECRTKRDLLGGTTGIGLAGNANGPNGAKVPGLRALKSDGTTWTREQLITSLQLGVKPNGDFLGDTMAEMVANSTSQLTDDDLAALEGGWLA